MSSPIGLNYVGPAPSVSGDLTNRLATSTILNSGPTSQAWVTSQVASLTTQNYMARTTFDQQTATYATPSYATAQNALLVPTSAAGTVNQVAGANTPIIGSYYGVATLDSTTHVPLGQVPVSGTSYILGPYGPTASSSGSSVSGTPYKIADWAIGRANAQFRVWVYLQAQVTVTMGHPIIEVRIANSTTAPSSYATAGTLVALAEGRSNYSDLHSLATIPVPDTTSQTPTLLPASYNIWLTAWLNDANSSTVTLANGDIKSAAAYLVRGAL